MRDTDAWSRIERALHEGLARQQKETVERRSVVCGVGTGARVTSANAVRKISIAVEARPVLSYPMAHNEIPVISRLAIDQVDRDVQGALLRLEVADASGAIGRSQEVPLDLQADRPLC